MGKNLFYLVGGLIIIFLSKCEVEKEKADVKEVQDVFEIEAVADAEDIIPAIKCEKDEDCVGKMGEIPQCKVEKCDLEEKKCIMDTAEDGSSCDDFNPCTINDKCKNGECVGGENQCECNEDKDCAIYEDPDLCNGTLYCQKEKVPYTCEVDKKTIIKCDDSKDTFCMKNTCQPATGECKLSPVNEGENCNDKNPCTEKDKCVKGTCIGEVETICDDNIECTLNSCDLQTGCVFTPSDELCNDNNLCTKDICDTVKGCVFINLDIECDDGNACTKEDKCIDGKCTGGKEVICDDGIFCNGKEECIPEKGCIKGIEPTCDDNIECTENFCNKETDKCENNWKSDAIEGEKGSASCTDEKDNDCDEKIDALDPECELEFLDFEPKNGVKNGGTPVEIKGGGLDLVENVFFGTASATKITKISSNSLIAITPAGEVGDVDVFIKTKNHLIKHSEKFRYTGVETEGIWGKIQWPAEKLEIIAGTESEFIYGRVYVKDYTDQGKDPAGIIAEVGYGPEVEEPSLSGNFKWFKAVYNMSYGNDYEYRGLVIPHRGGFFDIAYRFSKDNGYKFIYVDLYDGSFDGYSSKNALKMRSYGVIINELMWMGSNKDPEDEWIELRNLSKFPVFLNGWKITSAKKDKADLLLDDPVHTINSIVIGPQSYFLISEKSKDKSQINVDSEIVCNGNMVLSNTAPQTYKLIDKDGYVIDIAVFSGKIGVNGKEGKPEISMERNYFPGDGTLDKNWHNADCSKGWDEEDPILHFGTPSLPNCDTEIPD